MPHLSLNILAFFFFRIQRHLYRIPLIFTVFCAVLFSTSVAAEPRIALVIGNGDYQSIQRLENPTADAKLIAQTLTKVGFDVDLLVNGDQNAMKRAVADFGRKLRAAGPDAVSLFYYAGHGLQYDSANYLLPVDGFLQDAADLDLVGVQADWVLRQLFSARNRTNIVILDACRNNPFGVQAGMRQNGLAEMNAPPGTFIAYAAAPGSVALDGRAGQNSPFSGSLSEGILVKGQPIEQVFKQVRVAVTQKTRGQQTPWDSSSLTSEFFFEPAAPVDPREVAARQLWDTVSKSGDSVQIILFLRQYPDSSVSDEARALLRQSMASEMGAVPQAGAPSAGPAPQAAVAPPPPAAPAPAPLSASESELIAQAQTSGTMADYEAYLTAFPRGVFVDLVTAEIAALRAKPPAGAAPPPLPQTVLPEPAPPAQGQTAMLTEGPITFHAPLNRGDPIDGRSIAQIIEGSPQYPPVAGLPDSYWKGKTCSNCHHWTQTALCDQGKTYLTQTGEFALGKHHPLDGFKQVLRDWASTGCN